MAEELGYEPAPFVLHDLRRTMRTRLASFEYRTRLPNGRLVTVAKDPRQRTYDQHRYLDEVREALQLWANKLRDIVEPPPSNLVKGQFGDRASA